MFPDWISSEVLGSTMAAPAVTLCISPQQRSNARLLPDP